MDSPLHGIKVVDFGQYVAAPGAGALLRNLGAEVVKVEPYEGEAARFIGSWGDGVLRAYNRGKHSIALNLREPAGVKVAKRLAGSADVLIQNMRPGGMARLGLGAETLRELNPRLVYATVTGFGTQGPSRHRAGLDIAAQAESGMMSLTGELGGDPLRVGFAVVDATTAHALAQAILAALFARERSGVGSNVEISLLDVAVHLQAPNWAESFRTGTTPVRNGNGQPTIAPAAELVRTADGHIVLSAYSAAHWRTLCGLIGREDLASDARFVDNPSRVAHRAELRAVLDDAFSKLSSEKCVEWLSNNGLVVGAVRSYPQVRAAADVRAGEIFGMAPDEDGRAEEYLSTPYFFDGSRLPVKVPAPRRGEHSVRVLRGSGFTDEQIEDLIAAKVVYAGE
ncbi:CoA transferase [Dactylosporangium roseum]|uniref:CoA transferase n=1 Tax=Dactylosporangium roseum TaxID=47989 RepID=A0ABY5YXL2_9ACTN|nr:CoA transferase [Dactylosporangium roseum]UWZ34490.1 CoA transferase [Dactylosporangium roseum]